MPDEKNSSVMAAIIVAAAILVAALLITLHPFDGGDRGSQGRIVSLSAEEFSNGFSVTVNEDYTAVQGSCNVANGGDVLAVHGQVLEVDCVDTDLEVGFVYTYVVLQKTGEDSLELFFTGNLSSDIQAGDTVEVMLHVVNCNGLYNTFWGAQVRLTGEFLAEDFYHGVYVSQPMIPGDLIRVI
ncbi:MAG: hypothetical protein PHU95_03695 [Candidatus Thermoplasmatota archaeon]|nr:hypothetical protein [Candidatus Thermoplasmatota archaeon]MDD5778532.1 hypothetical protein [Candidatus Thermoplasmatota archaeon]